MAVSRETNGGVQGADHRGLVCDGNDEVLVKDNGTTIIFYLGVRIDAERCPQMKEVCVEGAVYADTDRVFVYFCVLMCFVFFELFHRTPLVSTGSQNLLRRVQCVRRVGVAFRHDCKEVWSAWCSMV